MKPKHVLILVVLALLATAAAVFLTRDDTARKQPTASPTEAARPDDPSTAAAPDIEAARSAPTSEKTPTETAAPTSDESGEPSTNRIAGRVVNHEDKPVAGATVKLSQDALMGESLAMDNMIGRTP